MTREEAIKKIKSLCHGCVEFPHCVNTDPDCFKALEMAIDSLKTDEAYQIEYENRDFIEIPEGATNGDMLLEILKGREDCIYPVGNNEMAIKINVEQWNSPYRKEQE